MAPQRSSQTCSETSFLFAPIRQWAKFNRCWPIAGNVCLLHGQRLSKCGQIRPQWGQCGSEFDAIRVSFGREDFVTPCCPLPWPRPVWLPTDGSSKRGNEAGLGRHSYGLLDGAADGGDEGVLVRMASASWALSPRTTWTEAELCAVSNRGTL